MALIDYALKIFILICGGFIYTIITALANAAEERVMGDADDFFYAWFAGMVMFAAAFFCACENG